MELKEKYELNKLTFAESYEDWLERQYRILEERTYQMKNCLNDFVNILNSYKIAEDYIEENLCARSLSLAKDKAEKLTKGW